MIAVECDVDSNATENSIIAHFGFVPTYNRTASAREELSFLLKKWKENFFERAVQIYYIIEALQIDEETTKNILKKYIFGGVSGCRATIIQYCYVFSFEILFK